jgi:dephospho-CoA kinase
MLLLGLTGGIASGKSAVSARLREHGAVIVDADVLAREVVEPGSPALAEIVAEFGPEMLTDEGRLDRPALGRLVFTDPAARARLNAITHPAVWDAARRRFEEVEAEDPSAVIVYDVPLLAEGRADRPMSFDLVVVVTAPLDTRIERMIRDRGMSRDEALHRIGAQASDAERLAIADVVIDNSGTLAETYAQIDGLWDQVRRSAESGRRGSSVGGPA